MSPRISFIKYTSTKGHLLHENGQQMPVSTPESECLWDIPELTAMCPESPLQFSLIITAKNTYNEDGLLLQSKTRREEATLNDKAKRQNPTHPPTPLPFPMMKRAA